MNSEECCILLAAQSLVHSSRAIIFQNLLTDARHRARHWGFYQEPAGQRRPSQLASGKIKRKWLELLKNARQAIIRSCTGQWGPTQLGQGHELTGDDISLRSPHNHPSDKTDSQCVCRGIRVYFSDNAFSLFVWFCMSPFTFLCSLISLCDIQGCPGTFYYKRYRHFFSDYVLTLPNQFLALYLMPHLLQK